MKLRSVMEHAFSRVPRAEIPRSSFDRSHGHKTTFDAGFLIPVFVDEVLPGDTFNLQMTAFARLATPIFPIMDNVFLDSFFFFVPYRLLWANWEKFNGAQDNPGDSTDFVVPELEPSPGGLTGRIGDYMGVPIGIAGLEVSALPFRAYALIWNEWFRDQNLQDSLDVPTDDGPDVGSATVISHNSFPRQRGKRHDYFTSCLPWPQKGDSVDLPLGTSANVITQAVEHTTSAQQAMLIRLASGALPGADLALSTGNPAGTFSQGTNAQVATQGAYPTNLIADLTGATAATINQLRQAFQIQKLLERDARGGTRYTEIVRAHFGVISPDGRLQRPEYLGGGSTPVIISQVPQTSESGTTPQGTLAAFGHVTARHGFTKSFTEHGVIIGLVSARADLTYQQGVERFWSRQTRYDFYWPALAMIGEQAVLNKEIFAQGTAGGTADDDVFGYQERYAEYRYKPSRLSGLMRSDAAGTLDAWHLSQDFSALPVLDSAFIVEAPPIDRVIAVPSEPHFIFDSYFSLRCARPMPMFGVPGLIDHF